MHHYVSNVHNVLPSLFTYCCYLTVNVVSKHGVKLLVYRHPAAETWMRQWVNIVRHSEWRNFLDIRRLYSSADQVGNVVIFDVMGNRFCLITTADYEHQRIYVKDLLTHKEYDRKEWMKWA